MLYNYRLQSASAVPGGREENNSFLKKGAGKIVYQKEGIEILYRNLNTRLILR
jgi:hypothetical protein